MGHITETKRPKEICPDFTWEKEIRIPDSNPMFIALKVEVP